MIGNIVKPGDKIDIKYLHQDNDKKFHTFQNILQIY